MLYPKTVIIVVVYLILTSLYGIWLSKSVKKSSGGYTKAKLSKWQAAAFLAGFTLGGASTYGFAGDTINFGYTYLFWFPFSVLIGWVATAFLFAKPYYRLGGLTVPSYLKKRFGDKTQFAASVSMLFYSFFNIFCFANIKNVFIFIFENINTRSFWQFFNFLFKFLFHTFF